MATLPAFQALLDAHGAEVWRFLAAVVGPQEADDCFQETCLAALRAYPRLRDDANLKGWLMTIAYRKAVDAHRGRGRRAVPADPIPERAAPAGADTDPELWEAVRRLPPMQRAAVAYRYVSDLAYKDIAAAMSCSEDAARQNVRAGLRRLKEVLSG